MKFKINKKSRKVLMIIAIVFIYLVSFFLYKEVKHLAFKDEKFSLYSYNNKANINYKVFLKPNILYSDASIGQGSVYLSEFTDYINATFNYEFKGERAADIKGDYDITAVVEGYIGEKETSKTIWKKIFLLLPKTNFESKDKNVVIKKDIPISYGEYNNFAKKVIEDSKFGSQIKLLVSMNVNLKANTDKGIVEEKISPSMVIPLNTNFFEVTGELSKDKPGAIEETKKVQLPINKNKVILYSIILCVFSVALIFLIFLTSGYAVDDPFVKNLNKIFKNYGDRLVALNDEVVTFNENISDVKSIEDLVKISDEIGKPIMYKHSSNLKDINEFYVFDSNQIYVFNLINSLSNFGHKESDKKDKKLAKHKNKFKKSILGLKPILPKNNEDETKDVKQ